MGMQPPAAPICTLLQSLHATSRAPGKRPLYCLPTPFSLTYDDYRTFKANPYAPLPNATAASVFGTCTVFPVDQCGMEGGLCGRPLAEPAPQCPAGKRTCESW